MAMAPRLPSRCLRRSSLKGEKRESRQPMFAHVVARDMRQADFKMFSCGLIRVRTRGMIGSQPFRDTPPAPGTAKVEAIEMGNLPV